MATLGFGGKNVVDIVKYRWLWLGISTLFLIPAVGAMIYSMVTLDTHSPVKLGLDFTGGTFLQYGFKEKLNTESVATIRTILEKYGQSNAVIQLQEPTDFIKQGMSDKKENVSNSTTQEKSSATPNESATTQSSTNSKDVTVNTAVTASAKPSVNKDKSLIKSAETDANIQPQVDKSIQTVVSIRLKFLSPQESKDINSEFKSKLGDFVILQVSAIGPALGKELLKNSMVALLLVFGGIVVYLSFRFQLDYAVCALIALFHDALFVMGTFSLLGLLYDTSLRDIVSKIIVTPEVDSLFVTAVLTVIGFSVHDTIVVFDRLRENARFLSKKKSFSEIANDSVNQTLARSINTSLTAILVLLSLYFLGGATTKDFVFVMALGIFVGTYSSIFNALVLVTLWREINAPKQKSRRSLA